MLIFVSEKNRPLLVAKGVVPTKNPEYELICPSYPHILGHTKTKHNTVIPANRTPGTNLHTIMNNVVVLMHTSGAGLEWPQNMEATISGEWALLLARFWSISSSPLRSHQQPPSLNNGCGVLATAPHRPDQRN